MTKHRVLFNVWDLAANVDVAVGTCRAILERDGLLGTKHEHVVELSGGETGIINMRTCVGVLTPSSHLPPFVTSLIGHWLAIGHCLLAVGCWRLAVDCWPLAIGC